MRDGVMPTTMAINPEAAKQVFISYVEKDIDIIYISFSSALSGSYNNSNIAARELMEENSECNITVIDSLSASLGAGLLVYKANELKKEGKSFEYIVDWLERNKLRVCHLFTVNDLNHLHRGGRVSKATAIIGTVISIKPILNINNEGNLMPLCNVRGRKKSLIYLVDKMEEKIKAYEKENQVIFISHGDSLEDANFVADKIKERFPINHFIINFVSPTIGAHSGPGTIALFFMAEER